MEEPTREDRPLTPKQRNLVALLPKVESGQMTMKDAMKQAGYADSTAREQSSILGQIGSNTRMQEALRTAGFDEEHLAGGIVEGTAATWGEQAMPDYRTRAVYYKLGAELLDVMPATKNITAEVSIADLIKAQESTTPTDGNPQS